MNNDFELIKKIFDINYHPLTCTVFYIDAWKTYYLIINETCCGLFEPTHFEEKLVFQKEGKELSFPQDSLYEPFDNFIPHLSKKIKIQTRRNLPYSKFHDGFDVITEKRKIVNPTISCSGSTFSI